MRSFNPLQNRFLVRGPQSRKRRLALIALGLALSALAMVSFFKGGLASNRSASGSITAAITHLGDWVDEKWQSIAGGFGESSDSSRFPAALPQLSDEELARLEEDQRRTQAILDALFAEEKDLQNAIDARGPVPEVYIRALASLQDDKPEDFLGSKRKQQLQDSRVQTRVRTLMASADYVDDPGLMRTFEELNRGFRERGLDRSSRILAGEFGRFMPFTVGGAGGLSAPGISPPLSGEPPPGLEQKVARSPIPISNSIVAGTFGGTPPAQDLAGSGVVQVINEMSPGTVITKREWMDHLAGMMGPAEVTQVFTQSIQNNQSQCLLNGNASDLCALEAQVARDGPMESVVFVTVDPVR